MKILETRKRKGKWERGETQLNSFVCLILYLFSQYLLILILIHQKSLLFFHQNQLRQFFFFCLCFAIACKPRHSYNLTWQLELRPFSWYSECLGSIILQDVFLFIFLLSHLMVSNKIPSFVFHHKRKDKTKKLK